MMTGTPPPSWTQSHRALCAFAAAILIAPFLVVHLFDGQQVDEKPFTTLRPIAMHKRQLRLQSPNSVTSTTTELIGDVSTTTADQNEDGGSLIRRGLGGVGERILDHLWADPWWGGRQRQRRRRRRRKRVKGRGRKKKRCNRKCKKRKRKNRKRKKKPNPKNSDDPPFPPPIPPTPSPPFTQLPEQQCRQRSTDVIVQTVTLPTANVFTRSSPTQVTNEFGNIYHKTALWDTYCTTYEIISRRMTSADATTTERRNLQESITIRVYVFGRPSEPGAVELLTTSAAQGAIQEELQQLFPGQTIQISSITVVDDNTVAVSVVVPQRRLRRLSATSNRSKHTKSAHKDSDDEIEAANEEWRDMNIATLHHVVSDQPKPANNAKVNDDKKSLPYLSSQRSDFDILPFVCGSDLPQQQNAISIATQTDASPNRLARLVQMAERWVGYISVAIYGKKDEEDDFRSKVEAFWNDHAKDLKDKVIIHLVIDGRQQKEGYDDIHYPHNILRNIAMEHTPTDLVFYNDVDFILSVDSHAMILKHLSSMPQDRPSVMVLPAFERKLFEGEIESEIIAQDVPFSKANLLSQLDTNFERIAPFHQNYASGHGPTDYAKWYRAAEPYEVEYDLDYEPYFVVDKKKWDVPLFWEHFTGFGKNKQSWVEELAVAGFRFYVCPDAFIVHIDHSVDDQDERILRPSIIDEYGIKFQQHLEDKYGRKLLGKDDLAEWTQDNIKAFAMNMLRAE